MASAVSGKGPSSHSHKHKSHESTPICMPTLFIRQGKAVDENDKTPPCDAVERAQSLGLLSELAIVVLDDSEATWASVDTILTQGTKIRLEGVRTLDDALAYLDKGVAKVWGRFAVV